jgi:hypothetical protein
MVPETIAIFIAITIHGAENIDIRAGVALQLNVLT